MEEIVPLVGYFAVPVTELGDGMLIQDGTDTMLHLEQRFPERPMIPGSPVQRAVAWVVELFSGDRLMSTKLARRIKTENYRFMLE